MRRVCGQGAGAGPVRVLPVAINVVTVLLFSVVAISPSTPVTILCVDADATGTPIDGSSWARAYRDLQNALAATNGGGRHETWVADGPYKPTCSLDRAATFQLLDNVALYGGSAGDEGERADRHGTIDNTILNGNIGAKDDSSGNSYHVVTGSGTDATAVLDGFTVRGGTTNWIAPANLGGGMYNDHRNPTVTDCSFADNRAEGFGPESTSTAGGGMYNQENRRW